MRKLAQGITRYNISRKELMKLPIFCPTYEEQSHIAEKISEAYSVMQSLMTKKKIAATFSRQLKQHIFI